MQFADQTNHILFASLQFKAELGGLDFYFMYLEIRNFHVHLQKK
jgi:hypothetical protein